MPKPPQSPFSAVSKSGLSDLLLHRDTFCLGQNSRPPFHPFAPFKSVGRLPLTLVFLFCGSLHGQSEVPVSRTFFVSGVECGSCVYLVEQAVREVPGVSRVTVIQSVDNCADVTFDPKIVTEQQIAQAMLNAPPLHGIPYQPALRMRIPDYARHEAKIASIFAPWKPWVEFQIDDREKGAISLRFLPSQSNASKPAGSGWSFIQFKKALKDALPPGTTLELLGSSGAGR